MLDQLAIRPGERVRLSAHDPRRTLDFGDKESAKKANEKDAAEINQLQDILYAEGKRALLVVLQVSTHPAGTAASAKFQRDWTSGSACHTISSTG